VPADGRGQLYQKKQLLIIKEDSVTFLEDTLPRKEAGEGIKREGKDESKKQAT